MTKVIFKSFFNHEDERMAHLGVFTDDGLEIPVNISVGDATGQNLEEDSIYQASLWSDEYKISIYADKEERAAAGEGMGAVSLIPIGTFPADHDWDNFVPTGLVLFSGNVTDVRLNEETGEDEPTCFVDIQSYGFSFTLHYYGDEMIEEGYIITGTAWLYGDLYEEK